MASAVLVDLQGYATNVTANIQSTPRIATISFSIHGMQHVLRLLNPSRLTYLDDLLGEFYGVTIIDRNVDEGNQLEFGRYRVQLHDEDSVALEVIVDHFDLDGRGASSDSEAGGTM